MGEIPVKVVIDAKAAGGGQVHYDLELPRGLFGDDHEPTRYDFGAFVGGRGPTI